MNVEAVLADEVYSDVELGTYLRAWEMNRSKCTW